MRLMRGAEPGAESKAMKDQGAGRRVLGILTMRGSTPDVIPTLLTEVRRSRGEMKYAQKILWISLDILPPATTLP